MISKPVSQLLKQLRREERHPNFSPRSRTFRELLALTPGELHGFLEYQVFQRGDIHDLRCPGDDCAHFDLWRELAGFVSPDRVSEAFNRKVDDLRDEVKSTFAEIIEREASVVGDIIARRGAQEAIEYVDQMHLRAFVI